MTLLKLNLVENPDDEAHTQKKMMMTMMTALWVLRAAVSNDHCTSHGGAKHQVEWCSSKSTIACIIVL